MYDVYVQYMFFGSMKCNWRFASWLVLVYLLVIIYSFKLLTVARFCSFIHVLFMKLIFIQAPLGDMVVILVCSKSSLWSKLLALDEASKFCLGHGKQLQGLWRDPWFIHIYEFYWHPSHMFMMFWPVKHIMIIFGGVARQCFEQHVTLKSTCQVVDGGY